MAIEKVRQYFDSLGMGERVLEFGQSSATVELAAQAVGCTPERIAKTLSFDLPQGPVLIVVAGDGKIEDDPGPGGGRKNRTWNRRSLPVWDKRGRYRISG